MAGLPGMKNDADGASILEPLVMPDGDYIIDRVITRMILAGFEQTLSDCTSGDGLIDIDELNAFLAAVVEAGLEIRSRIEELSA